MNQKEELIQDVLIKDLKPIPDERGRLMEILRIDDNIFKEFGQVYITTVNPGVTKAWHYHKLQHDNFAVVKGMIKLVLYDSRKDSKTKGAVQEFFIGVHNPKLIQIPPMVFHGFKGISTNESIIINCPTKPYNRKSPDEFRVNPHKNKIPYDWERKDG